MKVAVTGASGLVGRAVVRELASKGYEVSSIAGPRGHGGGAGYDLTKIENFTELLRGADAVVHAAAHVHVRRGGKKDLREAFWPLNVDATTRLARDAHRVGVRRFVFLSSIGVNGDETTKPFRETDPPNPTSIYAESKLAAEQAITEVPGLPFVILRPPMLIGQEARGSVQSLQRLIRSRLPLPVASIANLRSMMAVRNLAALIETSLTHPNAVRELFLVADTPSLSTPDLIRLLDAQGRAKLLPSPPGALRFIARLAGLDAAFGGLWKTLEIDRTKVERMLDWRQPFALEDEIIAIGAESSAVPGVVAR